MLPRHCFNLLIICVFGMFTCVNMQVFTAVVRMEEFLKVERRMFIALKNYIDNSEAAGHPIPESVTEFHHRSIELKLTSPQPHNCIANPLNAFHFIKRMHVGWSRVIADINCDGCSDKDPVKKFNLKLEFIQDASNGLNVTEKDYKGAALALVRLWQTYRLDLQALLRGKILHTETTPLSIQDIVYICDEVAKFGDYPAEISWLNALREHLQAFPDDDTITLVGVQRLIAVSYKRNGMPWVSEQIIETELQTDPDNKDLRSDLQLYKDQLELIAPENRTKVLKPINNLINAIDGRDQYEALCRGEVERPINVTSRLKCFLRETEIPMYRVKEEVFNYAPRISLFYDVITEAEQEYIKNTADYYMTPSETLLTEEIKKRVREIRISQTAWLRDDMSTISSRLNRRIQLITGLSTDTKRPHHHHAESFQVLNYGIGGMYEPHLDKLGLPIDEHVNRSTDIDVLKGTGDRIATFMFYLSDVEAGGATVYMDINITVPVRRGAAAFWYNYKRNGDADLMTYHAGCPVLLGSKWVSNKWIRQEGQIFRRKCGLTKNAMDGPL